MNVAELMQKLQADGTLEKVAAEQGGALTPEDQEIVKIAKELYDGGRLFGHGVVAGMLAKMAEEAQGATGKAEPSAGNTANDPSVFKRVADKLMGVHGKETSGSKPGIEGGAPLVRAETTAPPQVGKPNADHKVG